jgi:DHA2 family multidrug resistance protein-like MFS transporter
MEQPPDAETVGSAMGESDGLPAGARGRAMVAIGIGVAMAVLDGTIANVALPAMAEGLRVSPAASVWVVNAFQLAVVVALLPCAALGDIIGFRRVFVAGLVVFTAASAACALAPSFAFLIAARALQGLGCAGLTSINTALLRFVFPTKHLGRAIGFNAMVVSVSAAAGPSVASAILAVAPWPMLFAVNVPLGVIAMAMVRALPPSPLSANVFDWPSVVLNAATMLLFIFVLDQFGSALDWGSIAGGTVALIAVGWIFVRRQLRLPLPLLPVDLLARPIFALSVFTAICAFSAQTLAYLALPFLFEAQGASQVATGLLLTPWPIANAIVAPIAGRLSDRIAPGGLGGAGMVAMAVGLVLVRFVPPDGAPVAVGFCMVLMGAGYGFFQAPNARLLLASAPAGRTGAGSGMLSTARLTGQTIGAALAAVVFRLTQAGGVVAGAHAALLLAACCAVAAAVFSLLRIGRAVPMPQRVQERKPQTPARADSPAD